MKKTILLLFLLITPFLATAATVTDPGDVRVERNNILLNTNLITTFSGATTGVSNAYGLGETKITCHTWTIESDKLSADVAWTIALEGSLDNNQWYTFDFTTTVADWDRHIVNKGANWLRTSVLRTYTGTAPNITTKFQSGCN